MVDSQEKNKKPAAWAFQKNSELVDLFNHHLHKMQETGTLDRLWKQIEIKIKKGNDAPKIQEANALGYRNVSVPFSALLTGIIAAIVLLGVETIIFCKGKYADDVSMPDEDEDYYSKGAAQIIYEINMLLLQNHSKLKDLTLLSKIKTLATPKTDLPKY